MIYRPWVAVVAGVFLLLFTGIVIVASVWIGRWLEGRERREEGPTTIPEAEIVDQPHAPPSGVDRIIYVNAEPQRVGRAPAAAKEEVEKFVEATKDTTKPRRLVPVRASWHDERLRLTVADSRGGFESAEFECPEEGGCDAWTRDSMIESRHLRAPFRFWPQVGRKVAKCAAFAGAGYVAGWAVNKIGEEEPTPENPNPHDVVDPWIPAGVAGVGCAFLEVTG